MAVTAASRAAASGRDLQHLPPFKLGGIPHDKYDMTTLSVRELVSGIYRDLGLNEILLGKEKYFAIFDGAGVLVDPVGCPACG